LNCTCDASLLLEMHPDLRINDSYSPKTHAGDKIITGILG